MNLEEINRMRRLRRKPQGISAVLLPFTAGGRIDESAFRRHLERTALSGLGAAVNMDTGYGDLLTPDEKKLVLAWTAEVTNGKTQFMAAALPAPGENANEAAYIRECELISSFKGVPVIFPSAATSSLDDDGLLRFFTRIAKAADRFLAFELGSMFSPHGRVFSERVVRGIMEIPQCVGLKHSSLDRKMEISRLRLRDRVMPGFGIYSGNDLAMDMIEYGSDYLLGLSTFAPEAFAARDKAWEDGDPLYFDLRDAIQHLGWVAFRDPVPAYKHSAAIFLKLTGGLPSDSVHPRAATRDLWDREALKDAARRLESLCPAIRKNEPASQSR
ncbi:MAG: dihydrodipicolinate synthase family protein [Acidobacteriota bacterium]|nr:dihydrodipicolinate synthase family protein [Acidobacteriota bacterium]